MTWEFDNISISDIVIIYRLLFKIDIEHGFSKNRCWMPNSSKLMWNRFYRYSWNQWWIEILTVWRRKQIFNTFFTLKKVKTFSNIKLAKGTLRWFFLRIEPIIFLAHLGALIWFSKISQNLHLLVNFHNDAIQGHITVIFH